MSKGLLSEGFLLRSATILHSSPMGLWPVGFVDLAAMVCGVDETKAAALLAAPKIPSAFTAIVLVVFAIVGFIVLPCADAADGRPDAAYRWPPT
jgi:hypothetical protein